MLLMASLISGDRNGIFKREKKPQNININDIIRSFLDMLTPPFKMWKKSLLLLTCVVFLNFVEKQKATFLIYELAFY